MMTFRQAKRTWTLQLLLMMAMGATTCRVQAQAFLLPPSAALPPPSWAMELSGYWVSLVTNNWRLRMLTPAKGDFVGIPLTTAAAKVADGWNPAKDTADGQQCKSYGAAAIMMRPEHLHITWTDNGKTLTMNIDAGMQTRVFHFGGGVPRNVQPMWQGYSSAAWVSRATPGYVRTLSNAQYLRVITTHMLPGYLRQNGIPYSAHAILTEDYDLADVQGAEPYLVVTTTVRDPLYLEYPLVLSAIFQKQATAAGWDPSHCSSTW